MKIRRAKDSEFEELVNIYNQARGELDCFTAPPLQEKEFRKTCEGEEILVATHNSGILGFVSLWPPDNYIHHLYVIPRFQGRRVGSELIDRVIFLYDKPLSLKSPVGNDTAGAFYEGLGFVIQATEMGPEGPYHFYTLL